MYKNIMDWIDVLEDGERRELRGRKKLWRLLR
jgi:hypothetical protein